VPDSFALFAAAGVCVVIAGSGHCARESALATPPQWGHVHRLVPLALAFESRGDAVLWAASPAAADRLRASGMTAASAGLDESVALPLVFNLPEIRSLALEDRPPAIAPRLFGATLAAPVLEDLLPIARDFRPDVIVADTFELATPIVARILGVADISHSFGPMLPEQRLAACAEFTAPPLRTYGVEPPPFAGVYEYLYLDIYPPSMSTGARDYVPHVQPLQPVPYETGPDEDLPSWITTDDGPPLVYVTLGTQR
jgi:UDP:flavonoid glycosyltransferase YjiC (YdhE family)